MDSPPDEAYLQQLCSDSNFKMFNLRRICEEGDVNSSNNHKETNEPIFLQLDNSRSVFSNTELCTAADRLGLRFEKEIVSVMNLVTSLPDNELKQDLLHYLQYKLRKLKQQVTDNCHAVIFSMIVEVE